MLEKMMVTLTNKLDKVEQLEKVAQALTSKAIKLQKGLNTMKKSNTMSGTIKEKCLLNKLNEKDTKTEKEVVNGEQQFF